MYKVSLIWFTEEFPQNNWKYSFYTRSERSAFDLEIPRQCIWKIIQEKFQLFLLPFSLISLLASFACLFFFKVCFVFTLTRYLLLIILSFDPFAPLYLPLNSRVVFIILIGKGKIGFTAEFSNRILLTIALREAVREHSMLNTGNWKTRRNFSVPV